jgi:carbamate kinase
LVAAGHDLIIGHGNGPQVGDILLHEETGDSAAAPAMPLETDVAMSQGQIGYWLQQALGDELRLAGIDKDVATVITQVVVDASDAAFTSPSKPIGVFYDEATAKRLARQRGWTVRDDAGRGWRRVVPSPQPVDIIEQRLIKGVADSGAIVIAAGGGGVPVLRDGAVLTGVDAVIDKDFAAVKLAKLTEASVFMSLTAVESASVDYRMPSERPIGQTTVAEMEQYLTAGQFAAGSMLPKVQAALDFVRFRPENVAIITTPDKAVAALNGQAGTIIRRK